MALARRQHLRELIGPSLAARRRSSEQWTPREQRHGFPAHTCQVMMYALKPNLDLLQVFCRQVGTSLDRLTYACLKSRIVPVAQLIERAPLHVLAVSNLQYALLHRLQDTTAFAVNLG